MTLLLMLEFLPQLCGGAKSRVQPSVLVTKTIDAVVLLSSFCGGVMPLLRDVISMLAVGDEGSSAPALLPWPVPCYALGLELLELCHCQARF